MTEDTLERFTLWAKAVDSLFCGDDAKGPDYKRALEFYDRVRSTRMHRKWHTDPNLVVRASSFVAELDPDTPQEDVTKTREFFDISAMSTITGLLTKPNASYTLMDILAGFKVLRRNRKPPISVRGPIPDISLWEREGTHHVLLNEVLRVLEQQRPPISDEVVHLSVSPAENGTGVDISLHLPGELESTEDVQTALQESPYWNFLSGEIPIASLAVSPQEIRVRCGLHAGLGLFTAAVLRSDQRYNALTALENEALSRLLHGLKNQLVAYQAALPSASADRTSVYQGKLDASRHKDRAATICEALKAITRAVSTPQMALVDPLEFFRRYVAEKIVSVPRNIVIDPPKATESCHIETAPDFMESIIENLVRNSVEAMPDGGEIRLDWTFDEFEKSLLVEVADNGPGMDVELRERLLAGEPVTSAKRQGSGIGMLTVHTMLRGIEGTISVESALGRGTRWLITFPSLEEEMVEESTPEDGLSPSESYEEVLESR